MLKYIMIGILPFLLSSCFSYYNNAERIFMMGLLDSDSDRKNNYDLGELLIMMRVKEVNLI